MILGRVAPQHAARAMASLPEPLADEVALRMVRMESIHHSVLADIEQTLERELAGSFGGTEGHDSTSVLAELLDRSDRALVARVLATLEEAEPEAAARIRKMMFTFDDLVRVDPATLGVLISECAVEKLAVALSAATPAIRELFLSGMSERAANMLRDEIETMPTPRKKAVEEAQAEIIQLTKRLAEEGRFPARAWRGVRRCDLAILCARHERWTRSTSARRRSGAWRAVEGGLRRLRDSDDGVLSDHVAGVVRHRDGARRHREILQHHVADRPACRQRRAQRRQVDDRPGYAEGRTACSQGTSSVPHARDNSQTAPSPDAHAIQDRLERQRFEALKAELERMMRQGELRDLANNLSIEMTPELRVQIFDRDGESMFAPGSADPTSRLSRILMVMSQVLQTVQNKVILAGHTDGQVMQRGLYTNWELSADRANAVRRPLEAIRLGATPNGPCVSKAAPQWICCCRRHPPIRATAASPSPVLRGEPETPSQDKSPT